MGLLDQLRVHLGGDLFAAGDNRCSLSYCVMLAAYRALALIQFDLTRSLVRVLSSQSLPQPLDLLFAPSDRRGAFVEFGRIDRKIS